MPDIGKRIRERREALGMTQEELAAELGYKNKSSIAKIETGTNDIVQSKVREFATALQTTSAYLMGWDDDPYDYDEYDLEIPAVFNGNVKKFFEFEKATEQGVMEEQREFDTFLQSVLPSERDHIEKFLSLYAHGKEMVDFTLQKEWERSTADAQDKDYLLPRAAHNDYIDEPGELEKMRDDLSNLKRPDAGR